ncbi:MAG: hypothetical protein J6K41_06810 [Paraprevotella sp.]|nr:hypothetical protein [Paraprevotella sp.]
MKGRYDFEGIKRSVSCVLAVGLLLVSCSSGQQLQGVYVGTTVGTLVGSSVGALMGGYRGHELGQLVGAAAGGAIGAMATAPRDKRRSAKKEDSNVERPTKKRAKASSVSTSTESVCAERASEIKVSTPSSASESPLVLRNLRYIDDGRNQTLNRKEGSKLIFELINKTQTPVRGIVPYVSEDNGNDQIYISPSVRIESIAPGEGIRYTVEIKGGNRLKEGVAAFRIAVSCDEGPFVTLREFTLPTAK